MSDPSPELLRRFYGVMLGRSVPPAELYEDVPFETYHRLQQIKYPHICRRTSARNAPIERFRRLADDFPDEDLRAPGVIRVTRTCTGKSLDLATASIGADVERLDVDRVKEAQGWASLSRLGQLRVVSTLLCKTSAVETIDPPLELDEIEIRECNLETVKTLLVGTRCRRVRVEHTADPTLDLRPLALHTKLVHLIASAGLVRNLAAIHRRPLTSVHLSEVNVSNELQQCLEGVASTVAELGLVTTQPLSPRLMPVDLPRLARMNLAVFESEEDSWLDYAAERPEVAFQFVRDANVQRGKLSAEVEDVVHGVDILKLAKGKKVSFEVAGDLAGYFGYDHNEALEQAARNLAKKGKRRIRWSSERDNFVATAQAADDLRWLIAALDDESR